MGWKRVFVMDTGSHTIKAGHSTSESCRVVPNAVMKTRNERKRVFVGDELSQCTDLSGLYYVLPGRKGYILDWDVQIRIWDRVFCSPDDQSLSVEPEETCLLATEPHCNFGSVRDATYETLFETYGFAAVALFYPTALSAFSHCLRASKRPDNGPLEHQCALVVDVGHCSSHVAPYVGGRLYQNGLKRIDVGGKALTNQLKEVVSYRQLQVMDETYVMNQCREDCCYVSQNFDADMKIVQAGDPERKIVCDYVLPDFVERSRGFILSEENKEQAADFQKIRLGVERFGTAELLFRPADVGVQQMGLAELAAHCVQRLCPKETRARLFANVVLTGGTSKTTGLRQRFESELRSFAGAHYDVAVHHCPATADLQAWLGGQTFAGANDGQLLAQASFDRAAYSEHGRRPVLRGYALGDEP